MNLQRPLNGERARALDAASTVLRDQRGGIVGKGKKTKTAVYHPPKSGMPYLVVTVSPEEVVAIAVDSKDEARILASKKTRKVFLQDPTDKP